MGDLTRDFSRAEFACKDGCGYDAIDVALVDALQQLRDIIGRPLVVLSGCRCAAHNANVGGVGNSQHMLGKAADVHAPSWRPRAAYSQPMSARALYAAAAKIPSFHGLGVDDQRGFVHLDIRVLSPMQSPARWCYRNGAVIPWTEEARG